MMSNASFFRPRLAGALMGTLLCSAGAHAAIPIVDPMVVNTTTIGGGIDPSVSGVWTPGGDYLLHWYRLSTGNSTDGFPRVDIIARRFAGNGSALSAEITAIALADGYGADLFAAALPDGRHVLPYTEYESALGNSGYARTYDAAGTVQSLRQPAAKPGEGAQIYVSSAALKKGWVTVYRLQSDRTDGADIRLGKYDADGVLTGDPIKITNAEGPFDSRPRVACNVSQDCVVVWHADPTGSNYYSVWAQRVDGKNFALVGAPIEVDTDASGSSAFPVVDMADDGDFVVAWCGIPNAFDSAGTDGWYVRRFKANGNPKDDPKAVSTPADSGAAPAVAVAGNGDYVVGWTEYNSGKDQWRVVLGEYKANGDKLGKTNIAKQGASKGELGNPALVLSDDGKLLVSWTSYVQDDGTRTLYGSVQSVLADGARQSEDGVDPAKTLNSSRAELRQIKP